MKKRRIISVLLLAAFSVCLFHVALSPESDGDFGYPGHLHCSSSGHAFVPAGTGVSDLSVFPLVGRFVPNLINPALDEFVLSLFKPPRFSA